MYGQLLWATKSWLGMVQALVKPDPHVVFGRWGEGEAQSLALPDAVKSQLVFLVQEAIEVLPGDSAIVLDLEESEHVSHFIAVVARELESAGLLSLSMLAYELSAAFSTEPDMMVEQAIRSVTNAYAIGAYRTAEAVITRYARMLDASPDGRACRCSLPAIGCIYSGEHSLADHILQGAAEVPDIAPGTRSRIAYLMGVNQMFAGNPEQAKTYAGLSMEMAEDAVQRNRVRALMLWAHASLGERDQAREILSRPLTQGAFTGVLTAWVPAVVEQWITVAGGEGVPVEGLNLLAGSKPHHSVWVRAHANAAAAFRAERQGRKQEAEALREDSASEFFSAGVRIEAIPAMLSHCESLASTFPDSLS